MPIINISASKDVFISEYYPTTNINDQIFLQVNSGASVASRSLLEFPLSSIPNGANIISATLYLYYYYYSITNPSGYYAILYKLRRADWVEAQATWNRYKTGSNWGTAGCANTTTDIDTSKTAQVAFPASPPAWMAWNVKSMVEDALAGATAFRARLHLNFSAQNVYAEFYSREYSNAGYRPYLRVEYEMPFEYVACPPLIGRGVFSCSYAHQDKHVCPPLVGRGALSCAYAHQDKYVCPPLIGRGKLTIADVFPGGEIAVCPPLSARGYIDAPSFLMSIMSASLSARAVLSLLYAAYIYQMPPLIGRGALDMGRTTSFPDSDYSIYYKCVLSGAPDLILPMANFQAYLRLVEQSPVSVVVPGLDYLEQITALMDIYRMHQEKNTANEEAYRAANEGAREAYRAAPASPGGYDAYHAARRAAYAIYAAAVDSDYCLTHAQTGSYWRDIAAYAHGAAANAAQAYVRVVPATGKADEENTGTGVCLSVGPGIRPKTGAYLLRCVTAVPGAGVFDVFDPHGIPLPRAYVGEYYSHHQLGFTLAAGAVDFAPGDNFIINVTTRDNDKVLPGVGYIVDYSSPEPLPEYRSAFGKLSIYMVKKYAHGNEIAELIKSVALDYDGLRVDKGPVSSSITLTGHTKTIPSPRAVVLRGAARENIRNNRHHYVCAPDYNLRPGDNVSVAGEEFNARVIYWRVAPGVEQMEVYEAE